MPQSNAFKFANNILTNGSMEVTANNLSSASSIGYIGLPKSDTTTTGTLSMVMLANTFL